MKIRLLALSLLVFLTSCFKDTSYESNYILKTLIQEQSSDPTQIMDGVVAYTYAVDTAYWDIMSYEDALAGIITSKSNPQEQMTTPTAIAVPYTGNLDQYIPQPQPDPDHPDLEPQEPQSREGDDPQEPDAQPHTGWLQMPIKDAVQMIVAVDPIHKLYAFTSQEAILNLPDLFVVLTFMPWREGDTYKVGNWIFRNDFFEKPLQMKAYVDAKVQQQEGEEEVFPPSDRMKVYAFQADTMDWKIESYDDAVAGRLKHKTNTAKRKDSPDFKAYAEDTGLFGMTIKGSPLMVVAVDRVNKLYAYTKQEPDFEGQEPVWKVVFRPWKREKVSMDNGWCVVNEYFKVAPEPQPEPQPDPEHPTDPQE